jgi:hypothetical protein
MKSPRHLLILSAMMSCVVLSGCGEVTIGPRTEIRTVIVKPGQPVRILENVKVRAERMDGSPGQTEVDVGGWVAMPPEHWAALKAILEKSAP